MLGVDRHATREVLASSSCSGGVGAGGGAWCMEHEKCEAHELHAPHEQGGGGVDPTPLHACLHAAARTTAPATMAGHF